MANGDFFNKKNDKKKKKGAPTGNKSTSNAPVFILPKMIEKKRKDQ